MCEKYKDKYFSILGDSISTYEGYLPKGYPCFYTRRGSSAFGIYSYRDTWWGQLIERLGARLLVNNSWSGSYVCKPPYCEIDSYGCSDERAGGLSEDGISPDVIIVYLGTNDRGYGLPLKSKDKKDLAVIENAYALMLDKLKANYPEAEIWCCTFPITSCPGDPHFEFPSYKKDTPMSEYGEAIKTLAQERGLYAIDLWDEGTPCETIDGIHPNFLGMCMIADKAFAAMTGGKG